MRRHVKPAIRYSAGATGRIASQVVVAVTTALLVALITNTVMLARGEGGEFQAAGMSAFGDASGTKPEAALPPLEAVVVENLPLPPSQPEAVPASTAPAGLYYAETDRIPDPLALMMQSGT